MQLNCMRYIQVQCAQSIFHFRIQGLVHKGLIRLGNCRCPGVCQPGKHAWPDSCLVQQLPAQSISVTASSVLTGTFCVCGLYCCCDKRGSSMSTSNLLQACDAKTCCARQPTQHYRGSDFNYNTCMSTFVWQHQNKTKQLMSLAEERCKLSRKCF